jgi:hypothetical protein
MQRITTRLKGELILIGVTILYAVTAWIIFPYLRYYVNNPDTISYLTIAGKYATGDFAMAVNGYWSPLISWMLAFVYIWIGNEILAFKILQLLIGWFALYHFTRLTQSIIHSRLLRYIIAFSSVPFMLSYSLLNLTPDLLFLAVTLLYLRMVSEREFFNYRHFGLIAGVLGVLLYFSKSFGYAFFLAHFSVLFFRNYFVTKEYAFKKHLRANFLQAMIFFVLITSIWIYLISVKYGHFTISENVYFNLSNEVAVGPEIENKLPILSGGLFKPANASAVNAWEDPGTAVKLTPLHPLSNKSDMQQYRQVISRNLQAIYFFDIRQQIGSIFLILLSIFILTRNRKKFWTDDYFFSMMITMLFIYGGYSLILIHSRYIWICTLLMLLIIAWLLEELLAGNKFQNIIIPVTGFFVAVLAVKRPVKEILFTQDKPILFSNFITAITHPVQMIKHTYYTDVEFFKKVNEMKKVVGPGENIISLDEPTFDRDCYTQASLLAYLSGAKYYGQLIWAPGLDFASTDLTNINHIVAFSTPNIFINSPIWKNSFRKEEIPLEIYSKK